MGCFACFDGGGKQQRKEEERLASLDARSKAAEAAQKRQEQFEHSAAGKAARARQEQFEHSAAGKAARAQLAAAAKQSANTNKGEPVLKTKLYTAGITTFNQVFQKAIEIVRKFPQQ